MAGPIDGTDDVVVPLLPADVPAPDPRRFNRTHTHDGRERP